VVWFVTNQPFSTATHASDKPTRICKPKASSTEHTGMVWVPAGSYIMGADHQYAEEGPSSAQQVAGFWMDQTEVTNAQFAQFVAATGYRTLAERGVRKSATDSSTAVAGSAVFDPHFASDPSNPLANWWKFSPGSSWRHPQGPESSLANIERHPVVHIAWEDAAAYAQWKGHTLPTESQFEHAAQGSARKNSTGAYSSNTWQGQFPSRNDAVDGYVGTAPVACYEANVLGLYDLIGNVWEWTSSTYYVRHDFAAKAEHPDGLDPMQPGEAVAVVKGGSYLCSPDYCMRYRPEARLGQSKGLGTSHIGFRTVLNLK
jgi:formylglycine-generating enzyme required for sulfatase activity